MKKQTHHSYIVSGPNGESLGPFALKEIKQLIAEGKVVGSTVIQRSDSAEWSTAAGFPELGAKDEIVTRFDPQVDALTQEMEDAYFKRKVRPGAVWFLWIGALSLPNIFSAYGGRDSGFALGMAAAFPIGKAGAFFGDQGTHIALGVNLALALLFFFFGIASWTGRFAPFLIGAAIYAGDTALAVATDDWISGAIHLLAIASFYVGIAAHLERRERDWFSFTVLPYAACAVLFAGGVLGTRAWASYPEQTLTPESWVARPQVEWPNLVLTHEAEFRQHTGLQGASAFLAELPNGRVVAVTARHLLGSAGGVEPVLRLSEVNSAIAHWNLFARATPTNVVGVKGLFGPVESYPTVADTVMLDIGTNKASTVAVPLKLRFKPVKRGEKIYVAGVRYASETQKQEIYSGSVVVGNGEFVTVKLDKAADFSGFSGAPMLDTDGHVIGVVTGGLELPDGSGAACVVAEGLQGLTQTLRAANALN